MATVKLRRNLSCPSIHVTQGSSLAGSNFDHVTPTDDSRRSVPQLVIPKLAASDLLQPRLTIHDHESEVGGSHGRSSAESVLTNATHYKPPSSCTDVQYENVGSPRSVAQKSTLSMDRATQTRPVVDASTEWDEDTGVLVPVSGKDQLNAIIDGLQQVSRARSNAVDVRSGAQEEAIHLRNLHSQLALQVAAVFEFVRTRFTPALGEDWQTLAQDMTSAEDLFVRISESIKKFDTAQERVQTLEWRILEKEERLYAPYQVAGSPMSTIDDIGEVLSELSSVPLSPEPIDSHEVTSPRHELRPREGSRGHSAVLEDAPGPSSSDLPRFNFDDPINIPLPLSDPDDEAIRLAAPGPQVSSQLIMQEAEMRLLRYGDTPDPEEIRCEGFQFESNDGKVMQAPWPRGHPSWFEAASDHPKNYSMLGFYQWISYSTPWRAWSNTTALAYQHRAYLFPVDTKFLRSLMLNDFEATCLELSSAPRQCLLRDKFEDVPATRLALMNSWLWEPTCPVGEKDHSTFAGARLQSRRRESSIGASSITENASNYHLTPVPPILRPRPVHQPSMSTIVQRNWHASARSSPNNTDPQLNQPDDVLGAVTLPPSNVNRAITAFPRAVARRSSAP